MYLTLVEISCLQVRSDSEGIGYKLKMPKRVAGTVREKQENQDSAELNKVVY